MKKLNKQQLLEQGIYAVIWIFCFLFPCIDGYFAADGEISSEESRKAIIELWKSILPFFILFLVNNYGLMPYFLIKKKYWQYAVSLIFAIGIILGLMASPSFERRPPMNEFRKENARRNLAAERRDLIIEMRERGHESDTVRRMSRELVKHQDGKLRQPNGFPPAPFPRHPFAVRSLVHLMMAFLMIGFNVAIRLLFKSFQDEAVMKELEHQRLQSELQYLKYQINPHFFMNTLNNIHALVDIDTGKAKSTLVELSKLMRYVLYEASNKTIPLPREIQFLNNYITLMSLRYTDKVVIEVNFPKTAPEVQIPPLLFVSFVENAFKHGVSYRKNSFVRVYMQLEENNRLMFRCTNSKHRSAEGEHHGIGLENIRKRLKLLFGNDYTLSITDGENEFDVLLIIPVLT